MYNDDLADVSFETYGDSELLIGHCLDSQSDEGESTYIHALFNISSVFILCTGETEDGMNKQLPKSDLPRTIILLVQTEQSDILV